MKIIVTGSHPTPILAILNDLQKLGQVTVIGRKYVFEGDEGESFEHLIFQKLHVPFKSIGASRLQRVFTRYTFPSIIRFPDALLDSLSILRKERPDVALSFGGYVSLPVAFASFLLKIPIVIHEQTQKAGLANKIVSLFAQKICISFTSSKKYFPKNKVIFTGNPMRQEIFSIKKKFDIPKGYDVIYVTGGSTGSHTINILLSKIVEELLSSFVVIHQTGDSRVFNDYEALNKIKSSLPHDLAKRYIIKKFIFPSEIGWVMQASTLVVSRAGINTVMELAALSKMCFLLPIPHGQGGEQIDNARLAREIGIGEYIEEKDLTPKKLLERIISMVKNQSKYKTNSAYKKFIIPDAASRIVRVVQLIYEKRYKGRKKI